MEEIVEEYVVIDGEHVLVSKKVTEKEVPPDLNALKLLQQLYRMSLDPDTGDKGSISSDDIVSFAKGMFGVDVEVE